MTKDFPPYAIVVGAPARIVRYRFSRNILEQLLELRCWRFDAPRLMAISIRKNTDSIREISVRDSSGQLQALASPIAMPEQI